MNPPFLELFRKFIRFGSVTRPSQRNKIVSVVSGVDISMWCALSIFCIVDGCSDMGKFGHHRDWMSGYGNIRQAISHQLGAISLQLGAISHQLGAIYIPPPSCLPFFLLAHRFHFLCLPNSQSSNPFQVKATNEERVIETEVWFDFSAFQLVRNLLVLTSFQKLPLPLCPS